MGAAISSYKVSIGDFSTKDNDMKNLVGNRWKLTYHINHLIYIN